VPVISAALLRLVYLPYWIWLLVEWWLHTLGLVYYSGSRRRAYLLLTASIPVVAAALAAVLAASLAGSLLGRATGRRREGGA